MILLGCQNTQGFYWRVFTVMCKKEWKWITVNQFQYYSDTVAFTAFILLHEKFLQFDWLRAVVFQLNLKYLHVKITNLLRVVV